MAWLIYVEEDLIRLVHIAERFQKIAFLERAKPLKKIPAPMYITPSKNANAILIVN